MTTISRLQRFVADEHGAVTVDWVVLTAAITGLAMTFLLPIAFSADNMAENIGDLIASLPVGIQD